MIKILKVLFWSALAVIAVLGCAKDKSSNLNVQCDSFGNCYDSRTGAYSNTGYGGYGYYGNNGYGMGSPYGNMNNPDRVILSGRLEYIENRGAWEKVQVGLGVCSNKILFGAINNCMQNLPTLTVVFENYKFTGPQNTSQGSFAISAGYSQVPGFTVIWRSVNGNTGYDTQVTNPRKSNARLRVLIIGRATDSIVRVQLFYGTTFVGEGQLNRVNR